MPWGIASLNRSAKTGFHPPSGSETDFGILGMLKSLEPLTGFCPDTAGVWSRSSNYSGVDHLALEAWTVVTDLKKTGFYARDYQASKQILEMFKGLEPLTGYCAENQSY